MSKNVFILVLCEDLQSQVFIRRALYALGHSARNIRFAPLPSGGAGDAYVRNQYPGQVAAFRTRCARAGTLMVVHIDADPEQTVAQRHAELASTLAESSMERRGEAEPIAELIPKRNIETWIYALDSDLERRLRLPLGEDEEYPKFSEESRCHSAAEVFAGHARMRTAPLTVGAVPSLRDGLAEFSRLIQ